MTFTFPRLSGGVYHIQKDSTTLGFIRKVNSSKWMVVDIVDTPEHDTKTLKEAKDACINLIMFEGIDNTPEPVYNDSVEFDNTIDSIELQRQMLASMKTYTVNSDGEFVEMSKEPTLEPVEF